MKPRLEFILLKLLEVLHSMPDGQCAEGVLKASVDLLIRPNSLVTEFQEALDVAEKNGWILGVRPTFGAVKWTLTDTGLAEFLKAK